MWGTCYDITTQVFTLHVGCNAATISQNPAFSLTSTVASVNMLSAGTGVYTFPDPTLSHAWCTPTNTLSEVKFNGAVLLTAASFQTGCTQPCSVVDLGSTAVEGTVSFKVVSTLVTG